MLVINHNFHNNVCKKVKFCLCKIPLQAWFFYRYKQTYQHFVQDIFDFLVNIKIYSRQNFKERKKETNSKELNSILRIIQQED